MYQNENKKQILKRFHTNQKPCHLSPFTSIFRDFFVVYLSIEPYSVRFIALLS